MSSRVTMFSSILRLILILSVFQVITHIPVTTGQTVPTCYFCANCPDLNQAEEIEVYQEKYVPHAYADLLGTTYSCATAIIIWDKAQSILRTSLSSDTLKCFRQLASFTGCVNNIVYSDVVQVQKLYSCLAFSTFDFYIPEIKFMTRKNTPLSPEGIHLDDLFGRFPFEEYAQNRYAAVSICVCKENLCNDKSMKELVKSGLTAPKSAPSIVPLEPSIPTMIISKPKEKPYRSSGTTLIFPNLTIAAVFIFNYIV